MHLLEKQVSLHFRVFPVIPSVAIVIQRPNLQHLFPHLQVTQHTPSGFIPPASIYCHQDTNIILIVKLTEYIWVLCFSTFWSSQTVLSRTFHLTLQVAPLRQHYQAQTLLIPSSIPGHYYPHLVPNLPLHVLCLFPILYHSPIPQVSDLYLLCLCLLIAIP